MDDKYESIYRNLNVTPTKQRVDLAQLIFSKKQHFTANDLIAMADKKKLHISMAICIVRCHSIAYNSLKNLT